jgi:hypothetical protein
VKHLREFFDFVNERELIRIRKESGEAWPWTNDEALRDFFYCNVFREDDKTTRWFKENVRDPLQGSSPERILFATVAFRWFNRISTGELIKPYLLGDWNEEEIRDILYDVEGPVFGGAYIIKSPDGMRKIDGILKCIRNFTVMPRILERTMETLHRHLMQYPYMGRFMAYEVVTDLRHTKVLGGAVDINTWTSAGPGAARGLGLVVSGDKNQFSYGSTKQQKVMLGYMIHILRRSRDANMWPWHEKPWEMREVEHCLCEFAKYSAARTGGRMKRKYDNQSS